MSIKYEWPLPVITNFAQIMDIYLLPNYFLRGIKLHTRNLMCLIVILLENQFFSSPNSRSSAAKNNEEKITRRGSTSYQKSTIRIRCSWVLSFLVVYFYSIKIHDAHPARNEQSALCCAPGSENNWPGRTIIYRLGIVWLAKILEARAARPL